MLNHYYKQRTFININTAYIIYNILMDSFDQTCRKSQEVQARLRKLLNKKVDEKTIQQTFKNIEKAQSTINSNKKNLLHINQTYNKIQTKYGDFVDSAAHSVQVNSLPSAVQADFIPQYIQPQQLAQILRNGQKIMILTGSSISQKSGLPLYKGQGFCRKEQIQIDLQNIETPIDSQILFTSEFFSEYPKLVWKWISDFNDKKRKAEPTKQHYLLHQIIQQLTTTGKHIFIVTQNIDNFHQEVQQQFRKKVKDYKAFPIYEIRGNITKIRCDSCSNQNKELKYQDYQTYEQMIKMQSRLKCSSCFNSLRPHVMFNDQFASQIFTSSQTVFREALSADVLLVVGTNILQGFPNQIVLKLLQQKKLVAEINQKCQISKKNVKWMNSPLLSALQQIKQLVYKK